MDQWPFDQFRYVAAAAAHIPGVDTELWAGDGTVVRVREGSHGPDCDPETFRSAVAEALALDSPEPLGRLLGAAETPLIHARAVGSETLTMRERGLRWRRVNGDRVTDYLLTDLDEAGACEAATSALGDVLAEPLLSCWVRRDDELRITVLMVEWPPALSPWQQSEFDEAMRDLSVICRVRADLAEQLAGGLR